MPSQAGAPAHRFDLAPIEAESKEYTKGEIGVIALDKALAELEREHSNGSPFPRVTRA